MNQEKTKVGIRYSCLSDLDAILAIENEVDPYPWCRGDFVALKSPGNYSQMRVAIAEGRLVGYAVFVHDTPAEVEILKLAVADGFRRRGIGTALLNDIRRKLWQGDRIVFAVRESHLDTQLFLRHHGFHAVIDRNHFACQDAGEYDGEELPWHYEDAYRFVTVVESPE